MAQRTRLDVTQTNRSDTTQLRCLGILDWGIGGIGFAQYFRKTFPQTPIIYLSDAGYTPYGKLPAEKLRDRLSELAIILKARGASHIVIACNAASTTLIDDNLTKVDTSFALPCLGVIRPTLSRLQSISSGDGAILILGGKRTIESKVYQTALATSGPPVLVRIAQPLSALVEKGITGGSELRSTLAKILGNDLPTIGTLVPACTHYMAVLPQLRALVRPGEIVDPAFETISHLTQIWQPAQHSAEKVPDDDIFLTTGGPQAMIKAAGAAFEFDIPIAEKLDA